MNTRKYYLDHLRILAAFAVVILHVNAQGWEQTSYGTFNWIIRAFYDSMSRWAVPVFVMISGALFLGRSIETIVLYKKYISRMVIAFIFWSFMYEISHCIHISGGGVSISNDFNVEAFVRGAVHLWFLLMIVGLYIAIPIFKQVTKDEEITRYFLVVSFVYSIFVPSVLSVAMYYTPKEGAFMRVLDAIEYDTITRMDISIVKGFSFYFILGFYLDRAIITKTKQNILWLLGIIAFVAMFIGRAFSGSDQVILSLFAAVPDDFYVAFISVFLFSFFKKHHYEGERFNRILPILSGLCFGAYAVHVKIIQKLMEIMMAPMINYPLVMIPAVGCLVFTVSVIVSAALNRVPVIKKYCV